MKLSAGCDLELVSRFEKYIGDHAFFKRVYTQKERERILASPRPAQTAAGIFCAKEAVSKALGDGLYGLVPRHIEITHGPLGAPEARLLESAAEKYPDARLSVSISHSGEYAQAFCVCWE